MATPRPTPQPLPLATRAQQARQDLIRQLRDPLVSAAEFSAYLRRQQTGYAELFRQAITQTQAQQTTVSRDAAGLYLSDYGSAEALSPRERHLAFFREYLRYLREARVGPMPLETGLLSPPGEGFRARAYDFVILPDDRIKLGSLSIADSDLSVSVARGATHAVLAAGGPVKSAGRLQILAADGKRLIFISPQTEQYRADYASLELLRQRLLATGVPDEEIFLLPA